MREIKFEDKDENGFFVVGDLPGYHKYIERLSKFKGYLSANVSNWPYFTFNWRGDKVYRDEKEEFFSKTINLWFPYNKWFYWRTEKDKSYHDYCSHDVFTKVIKVIGIYYSTAAGYFIKVITLEGIAETINILSLRELILKEAPNYDSLVAEISSQHRAAAIDVLLLNKFFDGKKLNAEKYINACVKYDFPEFLDKIYYLYSHHYPIYIDRYGNLYSKQDYLEDKLDIINKDDQD